MTKEDRDWYDTPLYYDIIFDDGTKSEADFLEGIWDRHSLVAGKTKLRKRRLLEPACGSGRLVAEMADRGWTVHGFDGNEQMLEFARERVREKGLIARLWKDRMESFSVPSRSHFDLVHCLVSTFKYLTSEADAQALLRRVSECLKPGGIFALGLHLTDYRRTGCEHERWVADRDGVTVVCNTRTWPADRRGRLERLRTRLRVTEAGLTRVQETHWSFRTYSAAELRRTLTAAVPELEIVACHDFSYNLDETRPLDDSYADVLLVLRKKQ